MPMSRLCGRAHHASALSSRGCCARRAAARGEPWAPPGRKRARAGRGSRLVGAPGGGDASTLLHRPWLPLLTVQLSLPPSLYLEGLPRKYVAAQLHLHWGQKGSPGGSEHQINSEATAAEVPG